MGNFDNYKSPTNLQELIEFMSNLPSLVSSDNKEDIDKYLVIENDFFNKLDIDQINFYINTIKDKLSYNFETRSIVDDLTNIYSVNLVMERLLLFLNHLLHIKLKSVTKNDISKNMFRDLQKEYFLTIYFENELRIVFEFLLNKHIDASKKTNEYYLGQLLVLRDNLNTKYIGFNNYVSPDSLKDINSFFIDDFKETYLDKKIKNILDILCSIGDDALENEQIYAYVMSYQTLLRSLFILLDDYHLLATYETYYMDRCDDKSTIKGIITSAFIANYHDLNDSSLSKTRE